MILVSARSILLTGVPLNRTTKKSWVGGGGLTYDEVPDEVELLNERARVGGEGEEGAEAVLHPRDQVNVPPFPTCST
jgi:hypothetical protein